MKPRLRVGVKDFSTQGLFLHGPHGRSADEFIALAKMKYGNSYSYKNVVYSYAKSAVEIICKKHGSFFRTPYEFLKGRDCPRCRKEAFFGLKVKDKVTGSSRSFWNREHFLKAAKEIHGNKYDYSKIGDITSRNQKITIICPKHGEFIQRINVHLRGSGCLPCGNEKKSREKVTPFSEFLRRAHEAHGDKYRYVEASYTGVRFPVTIICPVHGEFSQVCLNHIGRKQGCPQCFRLTQNSNLKLPFEELVRRAVIAHNNKYKYIESSYTSYETKMTIICPVHGEFSQTPHSHLAGNGCLKCGIEAARQKKIGTKRGMPFTKFIKKAHAVHGNKYQYVEASYINCSEKLSIICPIHGEFQQKGKIHITGHGCQLCALEKINKARIGRKRLPKQEKKPYA
jgi:hypothetical protein